MVRFGDIRESPSGPRLEIIDPLAQRPHWKYCTTRNLCQRYEALDNRGSPKPLRDTR